MKTKYKYLLLSTALITNNAQASWWDDVTSFASSVASSAVSDASSVASSIASTASTIGSGIATVASSTASGLEAAASGVASGIGTAVSGVVSGAETTASDIASGQNVFSSIASGAETAGSGILSGAETAGSAIVDNAGAIATAASLAALTVSLVIPGVDAITGPMELAEVTGLAADGGVAAADAADVGITATEAADAATETEAVTTTAVDTTATTASTTAETAATTATDTASSTSDTLFGNLFDEGTAVEGTAVDTTASTAATDATTAASDATASASDTLFGNLFDEGATTTADTTADTTATTTADTTASTTADTTATTTADTTATTTADTTASTATDTTSTLSRQLHDVRSMLEKIEHLADVLDIGHEVVKGSVKGTAEATAQAGVEAAAVSGAGALGQALFDVDVTSKIQSNLRIENLSPANQLRHKRIAHRINKLRKLLPEGHAPGAEMTQHSHRLANQIITNRIGTIGMALVTGEGVAAGDNNIITNPGIWLNAIGGKAIQGSPNGRIPGYKMTTTGFTLGGDALFNNNWLGGAAVTYSNAITKYTARKAGNKSTGKSLIFTLYGSYSGWENWVINATASYGNTRTVNKSIRQVFGTLTQTASAKYNANMYALNTNVAYTYHIANINTAIIPNVGLQYSSFDQAGYKETGTTAQNLTFAKMKGIAQGIVAPGLTFRKENLVFGNVQIIPEILGYVNYSFYKKSPSVRATTFANVTMVNSTPVLASMMQKRDYNFGCNLTAKTKQLEFTIGALATVVKKYKAYQGTLKLRVNL